MKILIAPISIMILALAVFSCSKNDSNDNNTAQTQNPVETPAPTPAPTATPTAFVWHSVTFEDASKLQPPAFDTCMNRVRFTVVRDGSFRATETCSQTKQSGHIKNDERETLGNLMNDISSNEAHADLKCKMPGPADPKEYLKITMTTEAMETFILLKQSDQSLCTSGDPADVDRIKQYMYQLKSLYVKTE